jgi:hypothetical protein
LRESILSFKRALSSSLIDGSVSFSEHAAAISKSGPQLDQSASAHENTRGRDVSMYLKLSMFDIRSKPSSGGSSSTPRAARRQTASHSRGRALHAFSRFDSPRRIDCGGCHRDVNGQLEMWRAITLIRKVSRSIVVGQLQSTYGL